MANKNAQQRMVKYAFSIYPSSTPGYISDIEYARNLIIKGMTGEHNRTCAFRDKLKDISIELYKNSEKDKADVYSEIIVLLNEHIDSIEI